MPSLRATAVGAVAVLGAVAAVLVVVDRGGVPTLLDSSGCTAEVDGHTVDIDLEQAENAALITAISIERGMPAGPRASRWRPPSRSPSSTTSTSATGTPSGSSSSGPPRAGGR